MSAAARSTSLAACTATEDRKNASDGIWRVAQCMLKGEERPQEYKWGKHHEDDVDDLIRKLRHKEELQDNEEAYQQELARLTRRWNAVRHEAGYLPPARVELRAGTTRQQTAAEGSFHRYPPHMFR